MSRWVFMLVTVASMGVAGCHTDYQVVADNYVRNKILANFDKTEAIPFFERRGRYIDIDGSTNFDRTVMLPVLKRLKAVAATEQWVMLPPKKSDFAVAVLVQLPSDPQTVDRMAQAVEEEDDKFPGLILQQWGRDWLSLNVLDKETYEFMKKSDPDIDKQR